MININTRMLNKLNFVKNFANLPNLHIFAHITSRPNQKDKDKNKDKSKDRIKD